jgi:RNA polymerase sigma factor (sigma-70 family)
MKILNPAVVNSNVFKRFLEIEENKRLYDSYLDEPTNTNADILNERFKFFEKQIVRIAYIKKVIFYESKRFDSKLREHYKKFDLSLDATTDESASNASLVQDENSFIHFERIFENDLESLLSDELLITLLRRLNTKQKQVLYYRYVLDLTEKEIADIYNVSQQAISKTLHKSINILREGRDSDD